jgi:hypothetical protein
VDLLWPIFLQREIIADEIQQQAHMLDRILQAKALGPMSHSSFSRYSPFGYNWWVKYFMQKDDY